MENIGKLRNMASVYLTRGETMLLLYRQGSRVVNNVWIGSAGGHFEPCELNDARACALRELREELAVTEDMLSGLELRYVTLRRANGEIRQNYYFFAELMSNVELSSNEGISKWFPFGEVSELEMPFTSQYVVEHYLNEGRFNQRLYGGVADGTIMVFTELPEF